MTSAQNSAHKSTVTAEKGIVSSSVFPPPPKKKLAETHGARQRAGIPRCVSAVLQQRACVVSHISSRSKHCVTIRGAECGGDGLRGCEGLEGGGPLIATWPDLSLGSVLITYDSTGHLRIQERHRAFCPGLLSTPWGGGGGRKEEYEGELPPSESPSHSRRVAGFTGTPSKCIPPFPPDLSSSPLAGLASHLLYRCPSIAFGSLALFSERAGRQRSAAPSSLRSCHVQQKSSSNMTTEKHEESSPVGWSTTPDLRENTSCSAT
ncbi:unnamed protein product [Pleuronectes platessa]|uniref:Uncharacterized protein n=1 Tax=Pleuronectes platessa TaxID=8262 RepID=A0A9N7YY49_PLEPL|nr:unnamed protein product [Pleuronectes platessa]